MIKLTYFTPTYNREKDLKRLYESLLSQKSKDFIWLIVDDGSTDATKKVVEKFISEKKLNIEYYFKPNGGKHTAIDYSNEVCKTDYICCVDSDDELTEDATDVILKHIKKIDSRQDVVGLIGRRKLLNNIIEDKSANWPSGEQEIFFRELDFKYNFHLDTVIVFKTNIIKKYHFPKIEDERFVVETAYYRKFLEEYKLLTIGEVIYITEYQPDGYSAQGMRLFFKNPKGFLYLQKQNSFLYIKYKAPFKRRISAVARYIAWKKFMGLKKYKIDEYNFSKLYYLMGYIFYPKFYMQYKKEFKNKEKINTIK